MKLLKFTSCINKEVIYIPAEKIEGFKEADGAVFIATGPSHPEYGDNGWWVSQSIEEVKEIIEKSTKG